MTSKRQKLARLETRADRFERLVNAALRRAIRAGTKGLGRVASGTPYVLRNGQGVFTINAVAAAADPDPAEPFVSLDDLAAIETAWQQELRDSIIPQLMNTLVDGANDAIEDLAREVPVLVDGRSAISETYLMGANNRLSGIGSDLWQKTRAQLVVGMGEGESIDKLAARVRQELASTTVRAQRIARTEVIGASNAGAYMQVTAMGEDAPETKVWLATGDRRTRPTHRAANGQKRPLTDDFDVGAASMKFPGDPRGPADEVVNCRCTVTWEFEPAPALVSVGADLTAAAGDVVHTSGMVALIPEEPRFIDDGEPADESHLTLWFLGDAAVIPDDTKQAILRETRAMASIRSPVEANAFGLAVWNLDSDDPCLVLNVGSEDLPTVRGRTGEIIQNATLHGEWSMPAQHQPWAAHMCLGYGDPLGMFESGVDQLGPVRFDRIRVAFGDEVHDFPFRGEEDE